jgi:hypothetical protein
MPTSGQRLRPLAISLRSIRSAHRRGAGGAPRSFRAAVWFPCAVAPALPSAAHFPPPSERALRSTLSRVVSLLASRVFDNRAVQPFDVFPRGCEFFNPASSALKPRPHLRPAQIDPVGESAKGRTRPLAGIANASGRNASFAAPISPVFGHAKVPSSSRLVISHSPVPSN